MNRIEGLGPVLPTPSLERLSDKERQGRQGTGVDDLQKGKTAELYKMPSFSLLPQVCADSQIMLCLLELLNCTSRAASVIGEQAALLAPYIGLFSAPTYVYHASNNAAKRFQVMVTAFKVNEVAEGFFWGARAVSELSGAVSVTARSTSSLLQILGYGAYPVFGVCFTLVFPILLIILGAIGAVGHGLTLWRNYQSLKAFNEEGENTSLNPLMQMLDYLRGPVPKEFSANLSEFTYSHQEVQKQTFLCTHFSSEERYESILARLDALRDSIATQRLELLAAESPFKTVLEGMNDLQTIYQHLLTGKTPIDDMLSLYEKLLNSDQVGEKHKAILRKNYNTLKKNADKLINVSRTDMERTLSYNAILLFFCLVSLSEGILVLVAPQYLDIANYVGIGISVLNIIKQLYDKSVPLDDFEDLIDSNQ